MRLLHVGDDGEISLVETAGRPVPAYAIFSHIWDPSEEVTFQDLVMGTGKDKPGYSKIRLCAQQAARDGLRYLWVDTCCVDKSSSAELLEAINSQFSWFRDASRCYVYLPDVPDVRNGAAAFKKSDWFTRGWTLQEPLAPTTVELYSKEGERLGDKKPLLQETHDATNIPLQALQKTPISDFSFEERLSWAERRQTTHEEDAAYPLLGLSGVHMPPIYGEGREHAFKQLIREINDSRSMSWQNSYSRLVSDSSTHPKQLQTRLANTLGTESDDDSAFGGIFSNEELSASSASSVGLTSIHVTGIREVSRALLGHENFKILCTTAFKNLERRKARTHIRGFLKHYGRDLLNEAGQYKVQSRVAKFVQQQAVRIADEISFDIIGFDTSLPLETTEAKKSLDDWLSSLEPEGNSAVPTASVVDTFEGVDSDDDLENDLQFPHIELVADFLLKSEAFKTLVKDMQQWLKVGSTRSGYTETSKLESTEDSEVKSGPDQPLSSIEDPQNLDGPSENLVEYPVSSDTAQQSHEDTQADEPTPQPGLEESDVTGESSAMNRHTHHPQQDIPQDGGTRPTAFYNHANFIDLVSGLLNYWGVSFFFYDLVDIVVPGIPQGYKRLHWRCVSCRLIFPGVTDY